MHNYQVVRKVNPMLRGVKQPSSSNQKTSMIAVDNISNPSSAINIGMSSIEPMITNPSEQDLVGSIEKLSHILELRS